MSRLTSPSLLDWIGTWPRVQLAVVVPCLLVWLVLAARGYLRPPDPVARSRSRWAAAGALTSVILGLVLFQVPELVTGSSLVPASWIGLIALPLPIGLAVGILHDRLFDIEVVVNRTLVYGSLTLVVIGVYVVTTIALSTAIGPGHGYVVELVAIGLAALVALPLRDVLQRTVNRMMYGQRDEPLRAMRRLGSRLEVAADPDRAFPAIAETVADALRLPWVVVEVTDELGASRIVAERGAPVATVEAIDLVHGATPVGRLVLGVRSGDRGFRADELALLHDLARQAGAAIHAQQLRDALARSREQLVVAREEERRRLRRDLHDGLGPALAAIGMRAEASAAVLDDDPDDRPAPAGRAERGGARGAGRRPAAGRRAATTRARRAGARRRDRPPGGAPRPGIGNRGGRDGRHGDGRHPRRVRARSPARAAGGRRGRRLPDRGRSHDQRRPPRRGERLPRPAAGRHASSRWR